MGKEYSLALQKVHTCQCQNQLQLSDHKDKITESFVNKGMEKIRSHIDSETFQFMHFAMPRNSVARCMTIIPNILVYILVLEN